MTEPILVAKNDKAEFFLLPQMANRHGVITGATVSEMGPLLISRILQLNDTQEGVMTIAFKVADENGWLLLDLKDLQSLLQFVGESADELTMKYGNVSKATIGAIQRGLLQLEQ